MSSAGAPPVSREGFTFINNEFFAESSNHNRHRRATPAELKAHFDSGSDKDKPAHWFEAQLIHYGLPPSKTKAVARMRLFDAVKDVKKLAVPGHISRLETELKKEWVKNDRDVKKGVAATTSAKGAAGGGKRKAEEDGKDVAVKKAKATPSKEVKAKATPASKAAPAPKATVTLKKAAERTAAENKRTAKKSVPAKPPATSKKAPQEKKPDDKPAVKKQTARRGGIAQSPSTRSVPALFPPAPPVGRTKQTARRSTGSRTPGSRSEFLAAAAAAPSPATASGGRTKQTARRSTYGGRSGAALTGRAQPPAPGASEPPPPYSEFDFGGYGGYDDEAEEEDDDDDGHDHDEELPDYDQSGPLPALGLLNGNYVLSAPYVRGNWPWYDEDFTLTLTLAGQELWGSFDLGVVEGVLHFRQRPYLSSEEKVRFEWRGRENGEGEIQYSQTGWMRFLGGGMVEGELDYMSIAFEGMRDGGQGTRSGVPVREMRSMWEGYS
ncbi:hypothetical protein GE09DRAFT_47344 [Coniochaeta sp. 2T2.1]|nr:hypothetical protein GE09DRAFT_47344 [Coniochaeta sp. 2T2.1]